MEKFIYLLIGIGWIVYSIYKRSQKQAAKQTHQPSSQNQTSPKSLLEELLLGEDFKNIPIETDESDLPYRNQIHDEEAISFNQAFEKTSNINKTYSKTPLTRIQQKTQDIEQAVEDEAINLLDLNDFDLRKAVIYSEILKRPYS
ncbi:MAG: hypothetical protein K9J13_00310 [Saprospiraceae bacterium]|nr:hypothetical protein [Saprospiraceae bacterium]